MMQTQIQWTPKLLTNIDLHSQQVLVISGLPCVGKTTFLMLLQKQYNIDNDKVIYIPAYSIDRKLLAQTLKESVTDQIKYIFIDDAPVGWWEVLNDLKPLLHDKHLVVVVPDKVEQARANSGLEYTRIAHTILPMKFYEYIKARNETLAKRLHVYFDKHTDAYYAYSQLLLKNAEFFEPLLAHIDELNEYYNDYLLTGGMPGILKEYLSKGRISKETYDYFVTRIRKLVSRHMPVDPNFTKFLTYLRLSFASDNDLKVFQDTDLQYDYVQLCIAVLRKCFLLTETQPLNRKKGVIPKYYANEPFFMHVLSHYIDQSATPFEKSIEYVDLYKDAMNRHVLCTHLLRLVFRLTPPTVKRTIFLSYYKTETSQVDFVIVGEKHLPVFIDNFDKKSYQQLANEIPVHPAVVVTEQELEVKDEYIKIPRSLLLLLA